MAGVLIVIDERDNVAVAMRDISAGENVALPSGGSVTALADIPAGHKLAIADIGDGATIVKYGESIGAASEKIGVGDWVHTHNIKPLD